MEKAYWLGRKRASLKMAKNAVGCEARLIHYDLAGRYALKAMSSETQATDLASAVPGAIYQACPSPDQDGPDDA